MSVLQAASNAIPHLATTDIRLRRLLLAIDFSEQTPGILRSAIQIAKIFNSELFLLNAALPAVFAAGSAQMPIDTFQGNMDLAQSMMTELVKATPELAELRHAEIVAYADPSDLITKAIEDHNIDLVIAGSHGSRGMERLALGSTADYLLRTVRCPVLVIGPRAELSNNLFTSILLASGLTYAELRSAQYASALAEHFHSKLTLLHVVGAETCRSASFSEDDFLARLRELVPNDFSVNATATPLVEYGIPGDLIVSIASIIRATLVVTGAREEATLADHNPWSTVATVIRSAHCPVLCVRGHFG